MNILMISKKGQVISFPEDMIRPMGRRTQGIIGMKVLKGDEIIEVITIPENKIGFLLVGTKKGVIKKVSLRELVIQNRGGIGIKIGKSEDDEIASVCYLP